MNDPIATYVADLQKELATSPRRRAAVLAEVEDHLRHAARDLAGEGYAERDASQLAVARFGTARSMGVKLSGGARGAWLVFGWYLQLMVVLGAGVALFGAALLVAPALSAATGGALESEWARQSLQSDISREPCWLSIRCVTGGRPNQADVLLFEAGLTVTGLAIAAGHHTVQRRLAAWASPETVSRLGAALLGGFALLTLAWGIWGWTFYGTNGAGANWVGVVLLFGGVAFVGARWPWQAHEAASAS
ncbi:MAG: hypothetical protein IT303_16395 [Dehalococcoidia bacterium]|nr:hypothetical protein [Dehalococcoidia bacterium]